MSLKALIFDVDDTLINTESDRHSLAFTQAFEAMNLDRYYNKALLILDQLGEPNNPFKVLDELAVDLVDNKIFVNLLNSLYAKYC